MASLKRPCAFRCEIFRTLFSLPKDEGIRRKWLEFIFGTQDFPNKHVYVCDRHFSEDCFDNLGQFDRGFCSKLCLAVGSIPTIKPGTSHESPGEAEAGTSGSRSVRSVGAQAIINPVLRSSGVQTINTPVRSIGVQTSIIHSRNVFTQLSAGRWKVFSARSKGVQARVCKSHKATQADQESWLHFSSTPIKLPMERPSKRPRLEEEVDEQTEESMDVDIDEHLPHDSTYDPAASAASTPTSLSDVSGLTDTEAIPEDVMCSVAGCDSHRRNAQRLKLPENPEKRLQWVQFVLEVNGQQLKESSWTDINICIEHFTSDCFIETSPEAGAVQLRPGAVPSLCIKSEAAEPAERSDYMASTNVAEPLCDDFKIENTISFSGATQDTSPDAVPSRLVHMQDKELMTDVNHKMDAEAKPEDVMCSVAGCDSHRRNAQRLKLPENPEKRLQWVQFVLEVNGQQLKESSWTDINICIEHFTSDCFIETSPEAGAVQLRPGAVPSLCIKSEAAEPVERSDYMASTNVAEPLCDDFKIENTISFSGATQDTSPDAVPSRLVHTQDKELMTDVNHKIGVSSNGSSKKSSNRGQETEQWTQTQEESDDEPGPSGDATSVLGSPQPDSGDDQSSEPDPDSSDEWLPLSGLTGSSTDSSPERNKKDCASSGAPTPVDSERTKDGRASSSGCGGEWHEDSWDPNLIPFTATPGPRGAAAEIDSCLPADFLQLFLTNELLQHIVEQTNSYVNQYFQAHPSSGPHSRVKSWKPVSVEELKTFFGLSFLTGFVKKPTLAMYWSGEEAEATPYFSKVMPRNRFQIIWKFLHYNDNTSHDPTDKLYKVRPVLDHIVNRFKEMFQPGQNICIDEGMMQWRGRLAFRVYNPQKPIKYGIKSYFLFDSATGYCFNMRPYVGEASTITETVFSLLDRLQGNGYTLYMDNFYNSVGLCERLLSTKTNVCGTLRKNRGEPRPVRDSTKTNLEAGNRLMRHNGNVMVIAWHDKRLVKMITTCHEDKMERVEVWKKGEKEKVKQLKPACVVSYNSFMNGVDKLDQNVAYYPFVRRSLNWSKKFVAYLFQLCIFNAYVLYQARHRGQCKNLPDFIRSVVKSWTVKTDAGERHGEDVGEQVEEEEEAEGVRAKGGIEMKKGNKRAPYKKDPESRLEGDIGTHRLECLAPTTSKQRFRRCRVCARRGLRSETKMWCSSCCVPLHAGECYVAYHTKQHYSV